MKKIASTRIPAGEATAFGALDLPEISGARVVEVVKNRPQSKHDWRKQHNPKPAQIEKAVAKPDVIEEPEDLVKLREQASLEGYTEGLEKGRQAGHQQGYNEGKALAQKELLAIKNQLQSILQQFQTPLADYQHDVEDALAHMAINIAEAVLQRELHNQRSQITSVVKTALAALPISAANIRLKLHPKDLVALQEIETDFDCDVKFEADASLNHGDCRLVTNQSVVEFSVSDRFKQTIMQMFSQSSESLQAREYQPSNMEDNVENIDSVSSPSSSTNEHDD